MRPKISVFLVAGLALTGCVAAWGDSKEIKRADEAGLVIQYDSALFSSAGAAKIAGDHCAGYGKQAEIQDVQMPGLLVGIIQETYACI